MDVVDLVKRHPLIYHTASAAAWPSIQKYGLLSTADLLELHEVANAERERLLSEPRSTSLELSGPGRPKVVIRDQKPMKFLAEKIEPGESLGEFLRAINSRVFFWPNSERLDRLRRAKEYRSQEQVVLHIDTQQLVDRYSERVELCRFNSGAITQTNHPARSRRSWISIEDYPYAANSSKYGRSGALAEVTVVGSVPDILELAVEVEHWHPSNAG